MSIYYSELYFIHFHIIDIFMHVIKKFFSSIMKAGDNQKLTKD